MAKRTVKYCVLSLAVLGVALIPSTSLAQVRLASKFPSKRAASSAAQGANHQARTPGSSSYSFTLLSVPSTFSTIAEGINLGATTSKTEIVGGYGPEVDITQGSFLAHVSGTKTVRETYEIVNDPHVPTQQAATAINDSGQIVGIYVDSSGSYHGYERSSKKFTTLDVTFTGATGTYPFGINNSGEIVGCWADSDGNEHGFTLIGKTYTSSDYPGGSQTCFLNVNSAGDIVGSYYDASGDGQSFLFSGGTYTSFAFPGAVETEVGGINDAGDIVGTYCATTECVPDFDGAQGFLLSAGVFTTIAIPGEVYTSLSDINNNGVIVGSYQDAAGLVVSFMATP
jgi:hypothetical protein